MERESLEITFFWERNLFKKIERLLQNPDPFRTGGTRRNKEEKTGEKRVREAGLSSLTELESELGKGSPKFLARRGSYNRECPIIPLSSSTSDPGTRYKDGG